MEQPALPGTQAAAVRSAFQAAGTAQSCQVPAVTSPEERSRMFGPDSHHPTTRSSAVARRARRGPTACSRRRRWWRPARRAAVAAACVVRGLAGRLAGHRRRLSVDDRRRRAVHRTGCRARPDLSRLMRRRRQRDRQGGRRTRAHDRVQERRHARRPGRRGAGRAADVRSLTSNLALRDRLHLRRGGIGRAGSSAPRRLSLVLHDRPVGVRPRQVPVLLHGFVPPDLAGVLCDDRDRARPPALQAGGARVRQRHRLAGVRRAGDTGDQEGGRDARRQRDARPQRDDVPHGGRRDRQLSQAPT